MARMPLLMLVPLLWSHSSLADEPAQPIDPAVFLTAYRPALKTLEERYANFTCRAVHKRPSYDAMVEYAADGLSFLSVQNYGTDPNTRPMGYPQTHVRSESPAGSFELSKQNGAAEFFISGLGSSNEEVLKRYHRRYNKPVALAATHIFDVSMKTLINSENAKLIRASSSARQGRDVVIVEFELDRAMFRSHRARVSVQPSRDYQVVAYELFYSADPSENESVVVYSADIEYQNDPKAACDVPSNVVIRVDDGKRRTVLEAATVDNYRFRSVTEDRFQPSAFGILNTTTAYLNVPDSLDFDLSRVRLTVAAGQEVDALIPLPKQATAYRVTGAETALVCSRTGCWHLRDLPFKVPPTASANVTYRFKAENPGTETIKLTLITNSRARRIPVEIQVTVTDPGAK